MTPVVVVRAILKYAWTGIFFFSHLLLFVCISLIGVILWPSVGLWNKILFKKILFNVADLTWWYCVLIVERWGRAKISFYGDRIPMRETAVVVMNHRTILDWLFLFSIAGRRGRLGVLKFFAKKIISYVPGFGWGISMLDSIYLNRNWEQDNKVIMDTFLVLKKRKLPFWTVSFLEGTRATPDKIRKSQEFCRSKNLPVLKNVVYPRTKGFIATMIGLRDVIDAVYDITFAIDGNSSADIFNLAMRCVPGVHIHIKRYPIEQIPKDEASLYTWCQQSWIEKDKMLDYFFENGVLYNPSPPGEWSQPFRHVPLDIWKCKGGE